MQPLGLGLADQLINQMLIHRPSQVRIRGLWLGYVLAAYRPPES